MESDVQLLRRYVREGSEPAFGEVVERHLGWAYVTALRQTSGDSQTAQDIALAVFTALATKASTLSDDTILVGWLYRAILFEAQRERRSDQRRRQREELAMQLAQSPPDPDWESVKPILDESLGKLPHQDRMTILLRYFERRSLKEMGEILRCGESGASRRTTRALDKLRRVLAARGINTTAAALSVALMTGTSVAAPVGLTSAIAAASLSTAATAASSGILLNLLSMAKIKIGVVAAVAMVGFGTAIVLQVRSIRSLQLENTRLRGEIERLSQPNPDPSTANLGLGARVASDNPADQFELVRLRGEVASLRQQAQSNATAARTIAHPSTPRSAASPSALPANFIPIAEVRNNGIADPKSSFETYAWAKANRDIGTMANALVLDDNARTRAEALLQSLPESQRNQYPSAEYLLASLIARTTEVAGLHVASQTPSGPDEMIVHAEWQYDDGRLRDGDLRYHRYPDGWRQVIPQGLVDKLGSLVGQFLSGAGTTGK